LISGVQSGQRREQAFLQGNAGGLGMSFKWRHWSTVSLAAGMWIGLGVGRSALADNLLINGSFETPVITPPSYPFLGSYSFAGWNGYSPATSLANACGLSRGTQYGLVDYDGQQVFSLDGGDAPPGTWIEQTFTTTPGQLYKIDFVIGRSGSSAASLSLNAQVFDSSSQQLANLSASPPTNAGWNSATFNFVANSISSRLRFTDTSGSNPNSDNVIDFVSATAVPEPASMIVFALGTAGLLVRRHGRGNRSRRLSGGCSEA
jgi:hypothetical protein